MILKRLIEHNLYSMETVYALLHLLIIVLTIISIKNKRGTEAVLSVIFLAILLSQDALYSVGRFLVGFIVYMLTFNDALFDMKKLSRTICIALWLFIGISNMFFIYTGEGFMH